MDGFHDNPSINLHKEYMRADNIVELFQKYEVPFPHLDQLTGTCKANQAMWLYQNLHSHHRPFAVDIDMNTPWVLRAILAGGYRPRSVTVEYNRWVTCSRLADYKSASRPLPQLVQELSQQRFIYGHKCPYDQPWWLLVRGFRTCFGAADARIWLLIGGFWWKWE